MYAAQGLTRTLGDAPQEEAALQEAEGRMQQVSERLASAQATGRAAAQALAQIASGVSSLAGNADGGLLQARTGARPPLCTGVMG